MGAAVQKGTYDGTGTGPVPTQKRDHCTIEVSGRPFPKSHVTFP